MKIETLFRLLGVELVSKFEAMPPGYMPARNVGLGPGRVQWGHWLLSGGETQVGIQLHCEAANKVYFVRAEDQDGAELKVFVPRHSRFAFSVTLLPTSTTVYWAAHTI